MDGFEKTPPHLMTMSRRLKADMAAVIRRHQSWNPHDIVNKHGLLNSLVFLKLDIGLTQPMDLFAEKVLTRRLSSVSEAMPHAVFPRTYEEIQLATACVRHPDALNHCFVNVCMHTMNAKAWATLEASRLVFGELDTDDDTWYGAKRAEELAIAKLLSDFLRDNGLI